MAGKHGTTRISDGWILHRGHEPSSTPLHEERLVAVMGVLIATGARTVLDLGCGSSALLERLLASPQFTSVVGLDQSLTALSEAEHRLLRIDRIGTS